jgi:phosphoribosylaminoimidazolecarboxamide formyltransferase/IMP cyclohydrolase
VVVNLYPFETTIAKEGVTLAEAIEQIDIGGPSMLRASAKNHRHVVVLCDPSMYGEFLAELEKGEVSEEFRFRCAVRVFEKTSCVRHCHRRVSAQTTDNRQPTTGFGSQAGEVSGSPLRREPASVGGLLCRRAASSRSSSCREKSCRTTTCSISTRRSNWRTRSRARGRDHQAHESLRRCATRRSPTRCAPRSSPIRCPRSAGSSARTASFDEECARVVAEMFLEVIVAPSFSAGALEVLAKKKNLRLVVSSRSAEEHEFRSAAGGLFMQSADRIASRDSWKVVTERQPTPRR